MLISLPTPIASYKRISYRKKEVCDEVRDRYCTYVWRRKKPKPVCVYNSYTDVRLIRRRTSEFIFMELCNAVLPLSRLVLARGTSLFMRCAVRTWVYTIFIRASSTVLVSHYKYEISSTAGVKLGKLRLWDVPRFSETSHIISGIVRAYFYNYSNLKISCSYVMKATGERWGKKFKAQFLSRRPRLLFFFGN